ncbi:MAG: carboxypeptidase-like regulatory domain-containing protein [Candidatus Scalindua sp.]|nr:carboxypeptidase-like regulatory domain-containing protein [Candidatus Scalindua sp.]
MIYRFFFVSFLLFTFIPLRVSGDGLRLVHFDEEIDVKILEVNENFVKANIPDKDILSVTIKSELGSQYPDAVVVDVHGESCRIVCKIIEVSQKPRGITFMVPRQDVSTIQIAFDRGYDLPGGHGEAVERKEETEKQQLSPIDPDKLREQIKGDLLSEFEKKQEKEDMAIEEMKEELRLEFEEMEVEKEKRMVESNFGDVKGRMLLKGKPLQGCQVKIVMLDEWGLMGGVKEGARFETITDENGRYHFERIPPGGYKVYWKPPAETSWIRKMKMEPDFYVEVGETCYTPDRETNVRTAN